MAVCDIQIERWEGCYDDSWRDLIVPEAFSHPAKMARGLVVRIFDELIAMGALQPGETVLDPFGGIGSTMIEGSSRGFRCISVELEPKFHTLAQQNAVLHRRTREAFGCPEPVLICGDSRTLREHVGPALASCVVGSPPFSPTGCQPTGQGQGVRADYKAGKRTAESPDTTYGTSPGQLGAMPSGSVDSIVSSPPYADSVDAKSHGIDWTKMGPATGNRKRGEDSKHGQTFRDQLSYGASAGQLGAMPAGDVSAIVSSPPYAEIASGAGGLNTKKPAKEGQQGGRNPQGASQDTDQRYGDSAGQLAKLPAGEINAIVSSPPYVSGGHHPDQTGAWNTNDRGQGGTKDIAGYGRSDGQLGQMKAGAVDSIVSSPPYEGSVNREGEWRKSLDPQKNSYPQNRSDEYLARNRETEKYGVSQGQLGQTSGDTFWAAARDILAECHAILKPGGVAVWVVKHFVRKRQLVDFPGDWRRLCEHVGFETVMEAHASLVATEDKPDLFDGTRTVRTERKSFFRRLAEKKGSPPIDYETVLFCRKP